VYPINLTTFWWKEHDLLISFLVLRFRIDRKEKKKKRKKKKEKKRKEKKKSYHIKETSCKKTSFDSSSDRTLDLGTSFKAILSVSCWEISSLSNNAPANTLPAPPDPNFSSFRIWLSKSRSKNPGIVISFFFFESFVNRSKKETKEGENNNQEWCSLRLHQLHVQI